MYVRTEKDGETVIAVADTMTELSKMLGVTVSAVSKAITRGSKLYHFVPDYDEYEEGDEQ